MLDAGLLGFLIGFCACFRVDRFGFSHLMF